MVVRPILRPHIRAIAIAGTGIFLLGEKKRRLLRGRLYETLLPLVDGKRTADEIVEALQPNFPATHVYYALLLLEQKGYITDSDQQFPRANAGFWSLHGLDGRRVDCKLAGTTVSIKALSAHLAAEPLANALTGAGVRCGDEGDLTVVLVDDYLDLRLETINRSALSTGHSWVLAKPTGSKPWVGPLFSPFKSGCWECFAYRLREDRELERSLLMGNEPSVPDCDTQLTRQIVYNILVMEVLKWIASEQESKLFGTVLSLDISTWLTETHALVRHPYCPACGRDHRPIDSVPMEVAHRRIMFSADGGYRCSTPEETLQRYGYHVSPITGAVRALYRHPHATSAINAYLAVIGRAGREEPCAARALLNCSGGKGMTAMQAKASALCEALERYSGAYQGYEPSVVSTLKALGDRAIHPNSCMLYSDEQYRSRAGGKTHRSKYSMVPEPFDETMEIRWSPVWSLSRKEFRYLPTSYCYFGYNDFPGLPRSIGSCVACSNGNAAGNTLEEGILQALLELVERDSVGIWWYNSLRRPEVELSTFSEPYFGELQEHYQQAGRDLWVLDVTADLQIPTCAAISSKADGGGPILLGFGCHLDARLAILRALTEMNQMFLTAVSLETNSDMPLIAADEETANWMKTATLINQPQVVPDGAAPRRTATEYRQRHYRDICDAVSDCQANLEKHGLQVFVLDQTRTEIDLPVVKVFVPGLRHFWARFAPGRLYEVPVNMGWLTTPRREEELNPIPICV
jgi:oxazoline/thiazoline synthase